MKNQVTTFAKKLGIPQHHSILLRKARELGLHSASELIALAVERGCRHYEGGPESLSAAAPSRDAFSDEELTIALLSPCLPYNPRAVRVGAQMLGSSFNRPRRLAFLACKERTEMVVRHIAAAGQQAEPNEPFWDELLAAIPPSPKPPSGVLPHPSRFRSETGLTNPLDPVTRGGQQVKWLRPSAQVVTGQ